MLNPMLSRRDTHAQLCCKCCCPDDEQQELEQKFSSSARQNCTSATALFDLEFGFIVL
jgi:hypothetical protein